MIDVRNRSKKRWINQDSAALFEAILKLKTLNEAQRFFRDLLTEQEIVEFGQRWKVAQLLAQRVPYKSIEKATGMSSATIARIHKWLTNGMGGYRLMLHKQKPLKV